MTDRDAVPVPVEWRGESLRILDQTRLPHETVYIDAETYEAVAAAIRRLAVRGAPLIGIAAAYGLALAARRGRKAFDAATVDLGAARPTAVNLGWAIERVRRAAASVLGQDLASAAAGEAVRIQAEQVESDRRMGELGAVLIEPGSALLTHCNTGSLATGGIGTALGVVKTAYALGRVSRVLVDETRPLLQGARLTAWELDRAGIPYRLIVDAAGLIARGRVQCVVVGADRIAANGDVANKVGTYGLALAAREHGLPFYVVAPVSTIDRSVRRGDAIPIEERHSDEVTGAGAARTASAGAEALNPAFDVTPARFVSAIVTERGVLRPPFEKAIAAASGQSPANSLVLSPKATRPGERLESPESAEGSKDAPAPTTRR
jgi:methylthioribose-1-phosphate isomerase